MPTIVSNPKATVPGTWAYFWQRLRRNPPALFGLSVILLSVVVALLGYSLMPDDTPLADERADQIARKMPGFRVLVVKNYINRTIEQRSALVWLWWGQERPYNIIPVESWRIDEKDLMLYMRVYGQGGNETAQALADIVLPIYVGKSDKLQTDKGLNFKRVNGNIQYLDLQGNLQEISETSLRQRFQQDCIEQRHYLLGTDRAGRDMLSRLLFGVRISLGIGLVSVTISALLGIMLGSVAGFFGGWIDDAIMWLMTVVWSIPGIMLVIAISLALGRGVLVAFIAIGLTTWVEIARVVRGQIMSIKEKQFVEAARAMGMRRRRIIFVHILPNIMGPLIVILTSNFASAILTEAGLSFLGLSAQPPMPSWGVMVNEGRELITSAEGFYLTLLPSMCIALLVLAFNLFGNGLRDIYDPRSLPS